VKGNQRDLSCFYKTDSGMAATQTIPAWLSNRRIELLKLYPYRVSENDLRDIQRHWFS
jgi:hypothetical protein